MMVYGQCPFSDQNELTESQYVVYELRRVTIKMYSRDFKQRFMNENELARFVIEISSCDF